MCVFVNENTCKCIFLCVPFANLHACNPFPNIMVVCVCMPVWMNACVKYICVRVCVSILGLMTTEFYYSPVSVLSPVYFCTCVHMYARTVDVFQSYICSVTTMWFLHVASCIWICFKLSLKFIFTQHLGPYLSSISERENSPNWPKLLMESTFGPTFRHLFLPHHLI